MAPEIVPTKRTKLDVNKVYENHAELIYSVVRFYLKEEPGEEAIYQIAALLRKARGSLNYEKYQSLACLRITYDYLKTHHALRIIENLSFEKSFALLLRERFQISCAHIASILGISEGSVRTRLESARTQLYASLRHVLPSQYTFATTRCGATLTTMRHALSAVAHSETFSTSSLQHVCIRSRDIIEDWNSSDPKTAPPRAVVEAIGQCDACQDILERRFAAMVFISAQPMHELPKHLRKISRTPIFVKEGANLHLNWQAAPWYMKALLEGVLATALVLSIVLLVPQMKHLYEYWQERRLDLYSVTELASGLNSTSPTPGAEVSAQSAPVAVESTPVPRTGTDGSDTDLAEKGLPIKPETEFGSRDAEHASSDKIYRVLIKTDTPEALKPGVLEALKTVRYEPISRDVASGSELPGGIMFDVFIPLLDYRKLINLLAHVGGDAKIIITHSRERPIPGKAHFKIWLQRI